jgi:hypothetical protein
METSNQQEQQNPIETNESRLKAALWLGAIASEVLFFGAEAFTKYRSGEIEAAGVIGLVGLFAVGITMFLADRHNQQNLHKPE